MPDTPEGMFYSDRCKFCREFYEKAKPFICLDCWEEIKRTLAIYPELLTPPEDRATSPAAAPSAQASADEAS